MDRSVRWQPLLHASTRRAPANWRVRPPDVDLSRLDEIVGEVRAEASAVQGAGPVPPLRTTPLHLLLRHGPHTVIGGFARPATLSDGMHGTDDRCFVGWVTRHPEPGLPRLDRLEDRWAVWAADLYDSWMPLDWDRPAAGLGGHEAPRGAPPWRPEDELPHAISAQATAGEAGPGVAAGLQRFERWAEFAAGAGDLALLTAAAQLDVRPTAGATVAGRTSSREPYEPYLDGDYLEAGYAQPAHRRR